MSRTLNVRFKESGTRFLIYPQPSRLKGFSRPETIYVNAAPGTIKPGPEDARIYVVDADGAKQPYNDPETGEPRGKPPYTGPRYPAIQPDDDGHFDHIKPGTPAFSSATAYATVRCVLEIWEDYCGRDLAWHFRTNGQRLEVIPRARMGNAWSGDGYIELGLTRRSGWLCENFDVIAHEVGHLISWAAIGKPRHRSMAYRANDEACADIIAIVSSLHFDGMVNRLLRRTKGHLFSVNQLARVGELVPRYRNAFNSIMMSTVKPDPDRRQYKYNLSRPFTGAAFDLLVAIFHQCLADRHAISDDLRLRSLDPRLRRDPDIRREFRRQYAMHNPKFGSALFEARDYFGRLLARAWEKTPMRARSHAAVAANMITADTELSGGRYAPLIRELFARREILSRTRR